MSKKLPHIFLGKYKWVEWLKKTKQKNEFIRGSIYINKFELDSKRNYIE